MDSDVTLSHSHHQQQSTSSPSSAPTSPTSSRKAPNGTAGTRTPSGPSTSDDSDIEDDLIFAIQHKADVDEEVVSGGFLQRYFSNHSNSLPSR
ncbi:unnamed protein product [Acanthoscelides obtectus]|uniref:Uncharacterized protein n=1 Tax=Acanthoscelides obtectus TaxID=200917 RepID=A0A9P0KFN0_ACAOB|nr:unnamed protein product [Acanthoscelides obtectus]CAK1645499.1 hypothetical protein AOBTE_LOCUS14129 [Acanthoscelides obtectus]